MAVETTDVTRLVALWKMAFNWSPLSAKSEERGTQLDMMLEDCAMARDAEVLFRTLRHYRETLPTGSRARWADYVRMLKQEARPKHHTYRPPADERCCYCDGTGEMAIVLPVGKRGPTPDLTAFVPGVIWTAGAVYRVLVACLCTQGKRMETQHPLSDALRRRRQEWTRWMDQQSLTNAEGDTHVVAPTLALTRYERDCYAAVREVA